MRTAVARRLGPALPVSLQHVAKEAHTGVEQGNVDATSLTGTISVQQRREDARIGVHAGTLIDRREWRPDRTVVGLAHDRHHAGEGLEDHVVTLAMRQGPVRPKPEMLQ